MDLLKRYRHRRALATIRREFDAWGIPHAHLIDEELARQITEGCKAFARAWKAASVSTAEMAEGLRKLAAAFPSDGADQNTQRVQT